VSESRVLSRRDVVEEREELDPLALREGRPATSEAVSTVKTQVFDGYGGHVCFGDRPNGRREQAARESARGCGRGGTLADMTAA
jgi:hypothetical protein